MARREVVAAAATAVACGVAVLLLLRWHRKSIRQLKQAKRLLRKFATQCAIPIQQLLSIATEMAADMQCGLASDDAGPLKMICTPVPSLPTGKERGLFYGVDVGKTDVRIVRVQLGGAEAHVLKQEVVESAIPKELMVGSPKELYDYVAKELAKFLATEAESFKVPSVRYKELGFTVSFAVTQKSAKDGAFIEWAKGGVAIKDAVEKEALAEINGALERNGIDMRVLTLVNDTVGALAGARYVNSDVMAAVILGMGTNASYLELASAVPKWHPRAKSGHMVVNIEWGNFNSTHLPITEFDICLDAESSNPGEQIFEKLVSGEHLGELVRRVLLKIAEDTGLFGDPIPYKLRTPLTLRTPDMASMHQDTSEDLAAVEEKMKEILGIQASTVMMREVVVDVCRVVAERGARLAGAGIVAILKTIGRDKEKKRSVIAINGGLYKHYRLFRECLHESAMEMLRWEDCPNSVIIDHLSEGSSIGAAVVAAAHSQNKRNQ